MATPRSIPLSVTIGCSVRIRSGLITSHTGGEALTWIGWPSPAQAASADVRSAVALAASALILAIMSWNGPSSTWPRASLTETDAGTNAKLSSAVWSWYLPWDFRERLQSGLMVGWAV